MFNYTHPFQDKKNQQRLLPALSKQPWQGKHGYMTKGKTVQSQE